jgi:hypothetical protein
MRDLIQMLYLHYYSLPIPLLTLEDDSLNGRWYIIRKNIVWTACCIYWCCIYNFKMICCIYLRISTHIVTSVNSVRKAVFRPLNSFVTLFEDFFPPLPSSFPLLLWQLHFFSSYMKLYLHEDDDFLDKARLNKQVKSRPAFSIFRTFCDVSRGKYGRHVDFLSKAKSFEHVYTSQLE